MKTIHVDFTDSTLGTIGREGELNRTQVVFSLDEDLQKCDFINVVFGFNDNCEDETPVLEHLQPDEGGTTLTIKLNQDITIGGILHMQLVGYVVDGETAEPQEIAKSPVVRGFVAPGLKGIKKITDGKVSLLDRILVKIQQLSEKLHEHRNLLTLNKIEPHITAVGRETLVFDGLAIAEKPIRENSETYYTGSLRADAITIFTNPMTRLSITSLYALDFMPKPEFVFIFTSGETPTSFSVRSNWKWANDSPPEIKSNKKYIMRIFDGVISYVEVSL